MTADYIVCPPVDSADITAVVPGSEILNCSLCRKRVYMSPSGREIMDEYTSMHIMCIECFTPELDESKEVDYKVLPPTKEQMKELASWKRLKDQAGNN